VIKILTTNFFHLGKTWCGSLVGWAQRAEMWWGPDPCIGRKLTPTDCPHKHRNEYIFSLRFAMGIFLPEIKLDLMSGGMKHTQLTTAVPQVLRVVIARVDSHAIRIDSRQKPFAVVHKLFGTNVGNAECSRLAK